MPKYHLSPVTGKHEKCTAELSCRYGEDHFSTVESAKKALELRIATGDFKAIKPRYEQCKRCHTRDSARMVFDQSRDLCNACSGYDSLLTAQKQRDRSVILRRQKYLAKKQEKLKKMGQLELASDQARRDQLLTEVDQELDQIDFKIAAVDASSLSFTQQEFTDWRYSSKNGDAAVGGSCCYCGITDQEIHKAGYNNPRTGYEGADVLKLGVDRISSGSKYTLENMQVCCYGCNSFKSSGRTDGEMQLMRPMLQQLSADRIATYDKKHSK